MTPKKANGGVLISAALSAAQTHAGIALCDSIKNTDGTPTLRKDFTDAQQKSVAKYDATYTTAVNKLAEIQTVQLLCEDPMAKAWRLRLAILLLN
jgi:hypothetical protein